MNSIEKDIYLELLRASLWEREVDVAVFRGEWRWKVILQAFTNHDLMGVVANTITLLPDDVKPSMSEIGLVYNYLGSLIRSHQKLNSCLAEVMPRLEDAGCSPILLKGQGLSVLYPKNCVRSCGDLDIYVGTQNIDKAKGVLNAMATPEEVAEAEDSSHHYHINVDGIIYELHHYVGDAGNGRHDKEFKQIASQYFDSKKHDTVVLPVSNEKKVEIQVPAIDFNVWYILNHLVTHLSEAGVGFRQFCDWLMVIRKFNQSSGLSGNQISDLRNTLESLGLLRAWKILGGILVYQLGLRAEDFPLFDARMAKKSQGFIVDDMLRGSRFRFAPLEEIQGTSRNGLRHFLYNIRFYYYIARPRYVISRLEPYRNFMKYFVGGFAHSMRMLFSHS